MATVVEITDTFNQSEGRKASQQSTDSCCECGYIAAGQSEFWY